MFKEFLNQIPNFDQFLNDEQIKNSLKLNILSEIVNGLIYHEDHQAAQKYLLIGNKYSTTITRLPEELKNNDSTFKSSFNVNQLMLAFPNEFKDIPDHEKIKQIDKLLDDSKEEVEIMPEYSGKKPTEHVNFTLDPDEQAWIITLIKYNRKFQISEDKTEVEEWLPYFNLLLSICEIWIFLYNLFVMQTVDQIDSDDLLKHSLKQLELLQNYYNNYIEREFFETIQRMRYFYSVLSVPFWKVKLHYANALEKVNKKSAGEIYKELRNWKKIITCFDKSYVEKLFDSNFITFKDLPSFYCVLGLVDNNIERYHCSWDISGGRYAMARKLLGIHYYNIDQDKALEYFQDAINVNDFQMDVWCLIGYVYVSKQNWNSSLLALKKALQFDYCSFKIRQILSILYLKCDQKEQAKETITEVIDFYFEEVAIFEKFFQVCKQLAEYKGLEYNWTHLPICKKHWILKSLKEYLEHNCKIELKDIDN